MVASSRIGRMARTVRRQPVDQLPSSQAGVLRALYAAQGDPLSQSQIATRSGLARSTVQRAVAALTGRGYLERGVGGYVGRFSLLTLAHRAQVVAILDAGTPDGAEVRLGKPTIPARIATKLIAALIPLAEDR